MLCSVEFLHESGAPLGDLEHLAAAYDGKGCIGHPQCLSCRPYQDAVAADPDLSRYQYLLEKVAPLGHDLQSAERVAGTGETTWFHKVQAKWWETDLEGLEDLEDVPELAAWAREQHLRLQAATSLPATPLSHVFHAALLQEERFEKDLGNDPSARGTILHLVACGIPATDAYLDAWHHKRTTLRELDEAGEYLEALTGELEGLRVEEDVLVFLHGESFHLAAACIAGHEVARSGANRAVRVPESWAKVLLSRQAGERLEDTGAGAETLETALTLWDPRGSGAFQHAADAAAAAAALR